MSLTTELRDWAREQRTGNVLTCYPPKHEIHGVQEDLLAIADRIDIMHKHAIAYVDDRDPKLMVENGWFKLPLDADDVLIRVGDKMTNGKYVFIVDHIIFHLSGAVSICDLNGVALAACDLHHYHEPTVEDILADMLDEWGELPSDEPADKIVAKYAAKLQLKEDE